MRIEVGYGLEGVLSDAIAKRIISETITPRFKAGDFAGGIDAGVTQIVAVVDGEKLPSPSMAAGNGPIAQFLVQFDVRFLMFALGALL